jgi:hypothetical protein
MVLTTMVKIWFLIITIVLLSADYSFSEDQKILLEELPEEKSLIIEHNPSWHLGVGNYFDFPSVYQSNANGKKNQWELWPILNAGRTYQGNFYEHSLLQWNIMLSLPKTVGTSDLTRTLLSFDFLIGHKFSFFGSFYMGMSFFEQFLFFKDTGEVQTEGTGESGRFHRPSRLVLVSQQTLTLAYATPKIANHYLLNFKSYIFSLWESQQREVSYALNMMYEW